MNPTAKAIAVTVTATTRLVRVSDPRLVATVGAGMMSYRVGCGVTRGQGRASGARAVQTVHSPRGGSRDIAHIGSAHTDADLELLRAQDRCDCGQVRAGTSPWLGHDPGPEIDVRRQHTPPLAGRRPEPTPRPLGRTARRHYPTPHAAPTPATRTTRPDRLPRCPDEVGGSTPHLGSRGHALARAMNRHFATTAPWEPNGQIPRLSPWHHHPANSPRVHTPRADGTGGVCHRLRSGPRLPLLRQPHARRRLRRCDGRSSHRHPTGTPSTPAHPSGP